MQFLFGADIKNYLSTKCRLQSWGCIKESKYMYNCNCRYIVISNWLSVMLNLKSFFKERMLLADSCTPGALAHVNIQFQNRVGRCSNRAVQLTSNDLPLCQISSVGDLAKIKTNKLFLNNVSAQNPLENRKFPMRCILHLFFYNVFFLHMPVLEIWVKLCPIIFYKQGLSAVFVKYQ